MSLESRTLLDGSNCGKTGTKDIAAEFMREIDQRGGYYAFSRKTSMIIVKTSAPKIFYFLTFG